MNVAAAADNDDADNNNDDDMRLCDCRCVVRVWQGGPESERGSTSMPEVWTTRLL